MCLSTDEKLYLAGLPGFAVNRNWEWLISWASRWLSPQGARRARSFFLLTGLFNRRHLDEFLGLEFERARTENRLILIFSTRRALI
jgi:GGDEF domain-containing protein